MKIKCVWMICSLILMVHFSCRQEHDLLPVNARLKQVLLYESLNAEKPTRVEEEYEYNERGQISKVSYVGYGSQFLKYDLNEYNALGQLIQISTYNANSSSPTGYLLLTTCTCTYSSEGKITKETIQYLNGSGYNLFFYADGRLSRIENHGWPVTSDQLVTYRLFEYNAAGQPIGEVLYDNKNVPFRWVINTFTNGLLVKSVIYADPNQGQMVQLIKQTFDANKNLKIRETYEGPYSSGVGQAICKYLYLGE